MESLLAGTGKLVRRLLSVTLCVFFLFPFSVPTAHALTDITLEWDWDRPVEPGVTKYIVYYKAGSTGNRDKNNYDGTFEINDPNKRDYHFTGADDLYFFAVSAVSEGGLESDLSNEVSNGPHLVTGSITNSDNSVPADDEIIFETYISTRPGEVLTNESPDCGYSSGNYTVEVIHFPTHWAVGEVLIIRFLNLTELEAFETQVTLTGADSDTRDVQLVSLTPSSLTISPTDPTVRVPDTEQFSATANFNEVEGNFTVTNKATWSSSDEDKGTVDATGLFTPNHVGTTDITASLGGVTSDAGTVTVAAGPAESIALVSGNNQSGRVGTALASPFVVKVTDINSNAVSGTAVTFAVTGGGGSLSAGSTNTGSDGTASSTLTLGTVTGPNTVTATSTGLTGSPVTFSATGNPGPVNASQSTVTATSPVTADNTSTSNITITARDQYGNVIPGKAVTVSSTGSAYTLSTPANTDGSGVSTATLASTKAETKTVSATIDGVPLNNTATVVFNPGPASKMTLEASKLTLASDGKGSSTLTATIYDQYNNLVDDDSTVVTFAMTDSTYLEFAGGATATAVNGVATKVVSTKSGIVTTPSGTATSDISITSSPPLAAPLAVTLEIVNFSIQVDSPSAPLYDSSTGVHLVTSESTPYQAIFSGIGSTIGGNDYEWTLSSVGSIDGTTGDTIRYTAPAGIEGTSQTDHLTLTSASDENLEDTLDITVYNPLEISWPAGAVGIATNDTAKVVQVSGGTGSYAFQSSNPAAATVDNTTGSISPVAAGKLTIDARDATFGVFGTANGFLATTPQIEIVNAIVIRDPGGNTEGYTMESESSATFTATGGTTEGEVNWEAGAGSITTGGVFTAPTVAEGTQDVVITAYDKSYNKTHATPIMITYTVTVFGDISITSAPSGYDANVPATYPLLKGGAGTTYTVSAAGGPTGEDFTWSVKDSNGDPVDGAISAEGVVDVDTLLLPANGAGVYTVIASKTGATDAELKVRVPMRIDPLTGSHKDTDADQTFTVTGVTGNLTWYVTDESGTVIDNPDFGNFTDPFVSGPTAMFDFYGDTIQELTTFRVLAESLDQTLIDAGIDSVITNSHTITPVTDLVIQVNNESGDGIPNAAITGAHDQSTLTTDATGQLIIQDMSNTGITYEFYVTAAGYLPQTFSVSDLNEPVTITLEQIVTQGTISGTVTPAGEGISVMAMNADGNYVSDRNGNAIKVLAATSGDYTFSFDQSVSGTAPYTVMAFRSGYVTNVADNAGIAADRNAGDTGVNITLNPVTKISITGESADTTLTYSIEATPAFANLIKREIQVSEGKTAQAVPLDGGSPLLIFEGGTYSYSVTAPEAGASSSIYVQADSSTAGRDAGSGYYASKTYSFVSGVTTTDQGVPAYITDSNIGGTATSANGSATLPPGGVDTLDDVTLTISESSTVAASTGSILIFDVKLIYTDSGEQVPNTLINKVYITISFDPSLVPEGSLGCGGSTAILQADDVAAMTRGAVTAVPCTQILDVNYVTGEVTFWVDHLSVFGVGGALGGISLTSDSGGGCFIATAAYGSPLESHVRILTQFRDVYLMPTKFGKAFVDVYYRYSPALAEFMERHDGLKVAVRLGLAPVVGLSYLALHTSGPAKAIILMSLVLMITGFVCYARKKNARGA